MELILNLLGGLGLFLFGMNFMSQGLQKGGGRKASLHIGSDDQK